MAIPETLDVPPYGPPAKSTSTPGSADELRLDFENTFRGPWTQICARQSRSLAWAQAAYAETGGQLPFVDVGAGRGEFLTLLAQAGVPAVGLEPNRADFALLQERDLRVVQSDANSYLGRCSDNSLCGLSAHAVIEHLPPEYLEEFLSLAAAKIAPRGRIVLETDNPENWHALGQFWLDMTHVRPYHAYTIAFLLTHLGFQDVMIRYFIPGPLATRVPHDSGANYSAYAIVGTRSSE
jgi:O-antigen chain-terminating methyltransferase